MEKLDNYLRRNIGFEIEKGTFEQAEKQYKTSISSNKLSIFKIIKLYYNIKK